MGWSSWVLVVEFRVALSAGDTRLGFRISGGVPQPCQYWYPFGNQGLQLGSQPFQAHSQVVDPWEAVIRQQVCKVLCSALTLTSVGYLLEEHSQGFEIE